MLFARNAADQEKLSSSQCPHTSSKRKLLHSFIFISWRTKVLFLAADCTNLIIYTLPKASTLGPLIIWQPDCVWSDCLIVACNFVQPQGKGRRQNPFHKPKHQRSTGGGSAGAAGPVRPGGKFPGSKATALGAAKVFEGATRVGSLESGLGLADHCTTWPRNDFWESTVVRWGRWWSTWMQAWNGWNMDLSLRELRLNSPGQNIFDGLSRWLKRRIPFFWRRAWKSEVLFTTDLVAICFRPVASFIFIWCCLLLQAAPFIRYHPLIMSDGYPQKWFLDLSWSFSCHHENQPKYTSSYFMVTFLGTRKIPSITTTYQGPIPDIHWVPPGHCRRPQLRCRLAPRWWRAPRCRWRCPPGLRRHPGSSPPLEKCCEKVGKSGKTPWFQGKNQVIPEIVR